MTQPEFERALLFWLGAEALQVATDHMTDEQRAREFTFVLDATGEEG